MRFLRKILTLLPKPLREALLVRYHLIVAYAGALLYGNPSRKMVVIGVTGTKGKSTTAEMIRAILKESGKKVAIVGTIRFAIGDTEERNLFKMTMPGRFFIQRFLARALKAGCTHAVIEMTSEGAKQFRHKGIELNALVFTNLSPEHIESHGSLEKYAAAKLSLAEHLSHSPKRPRIIVVNGDDAYAEQFLSFPTDVQRSFSLTDAITQATSPMQSTFTYRLTPFTLQLPGAFNIANALAAVEVCDALGVSAATAAHALAQIMRMPGRAERIECGQKFHVIVDYAHTPDSLEAIYSAYPMRKICVLGNTGGGRDTWKRPKMGAIADQACDIAILTNEDPYDEDPEKIVREVASGFTMHTPRIIMDRREAIREAIREAQEGDAVLITGKGTDPYIMGPQGTKQEWSDARVATEELRQLLASRV